MNKTLSLLAATAAALLPSPARAIPAFARKTGMGCPACHESWGMLNDTGELFRDRGYLVREQGEETTPRSLDYVPVSLRTFLGYQYTATSHQPTDQGDVTVKTGGFVSPGADLLLGGALSDHASAFVVATGFGDDGAVNLESAWARVNDIGTSWLNLKVGRLELDLPMSEHRGYSLTTPYLVYHYHPAGSVNAFGFGDNQLGLEVMGHGEGPGLRYSLALLSASGNQGSAGPINSPVVYGHVTYTSLPASGPFSRVRVGLLGDVGFWPTKFKTLTPAGGGDPAPVAGTGTDHRTYAHAGGEAHVTLGPLARPFTLTAVWVYGQEDKGLVTGGTRDARFHGGFVEADWTPRLALTIFGRADAVRNLRQADPAQPAGANGQTSLTVGGRFALWLSAWGSVAGHVEASTIETEDAAGTNPVRATTVLAGFDLAI